MFLSCVALPPANLPHTPTIMGATPTAVSLSLSWQGPTSEQVTYYLLNVTYLGVCAYVHAAEMTIRVDTPTTTHEVLELLPNSAYSVTLVAVNVRGRGNVVTTTYNTLTAGEWCVSVMRVHV